VGGCSGVPQGEFCTTRERVGPDEAGPTRFPIEVSGLLQGGEGVDAALAGVGIRTGLEDVVGGLLDDGL